MNNNDLLTLLIAFVLGYFAHQMMRNMCGRRLVEGGLLSLDAERGVSPGTNIASECSNCKEACRTASNLPKNSDNVNYLNQCYIRGCGLVCGKLKNN